MDVLLCAATSLEIQPTIEFIEKQHMQQEIGVLITGVGLVAATHAITKAITKHSPRLVIQAGIAGSFTDSLPPGTVLTVLNEVIGDLGVVEGGGFRTVFDLGLTQPNDHPWSEGKLTNPGSALLQSLSLPLVDGLSVQEISTDPVRIQRLRSLYGAAIETMEGAALHYAALMEGVDFIQLRAVSNFVGERDKKAWKLKESIESLNLQLQQMLIKNLRP